MAITAAGLYALTVEKMFIDTAAQSIEDETHKQLLVQDGYTHNYSTHEFRDDVTNEVAGAGYSAGGVTCTGTELTIASEILTFDMIDTVFPTVTITDAMGGIFFFNVGSAATDMLILLQDFIASASATAANFTIQHAGGGVFTIDVQP